MDIVGKKHFAENYRLTLYVQCKHQTFLFLCLAVIDTNIYSYSRRNTVSKKILQRTCCRRPHYSTLVTAASCKNTCIPVDYCTSNYLFDRHHFRQDGQQLYCTVLCVVLHAARSTHAPPQMIIGLQGAAYSTSIPFLCLYSITSHVCHCEQYENAKECGVERDIIKLNKSSTGITFDLFCIHLRRFNRKLLLLYSTAS